MALSMRPARRIHSCDITFRFLNSQASPTRQHTAQTRRASVPPTLSRLTEDTRRNPVAWSRQTNRHQGSGRRAAKRARLQRPLLAEHAAKLEELSQFVAGTLPGPHYAPRPHTHHPVKKYPDVPHQTSRLLARHGAHTDDSLTKTKCADSSRHSLHRMTTRQTNRH